MPGKDWMGSANGKGTHNHEKTRGLKAQLRNDALDALGDPPVVLDAFAGPGAMYEEVYKPRGAAYVGCDSVWYRDERLMYCCDNRRLMRALDLAPFNVFDLDAFGAPWDQAAILVARRVVEPGEKIAVFLTDGGGMSGGRRSAQMARFSGVVRIPPMSMHQQVTERAVAGFVEAMRCDLIHSRYVEGKKMPKVRYYALVLRGRAMPATEPAPERRSSATRGRGRSGTAAP